jgi:regulator of protease activity HflC (stomatin/prohibitin superfamily)
MSKNVLKIVQPFTDIFIDTNKISEQKHPPYGVFTQIHDVNQKKQFIPLENKKISVNAYVRFKYQFTLRTQ